MAVFPADDPQHPLWRESDPAVDAALAAALPSARPAERPGMVRLLLSRGHAPSLVSLIEHLDAWGPAAKRMVEDAAARDLDGPIRTLIGRGRGAGCRHALHLIRRQRLARLAYLLTDLIRHGRDDLPTEAAAVLVGLVSQDGLDGTQRAALAKAVEGAVAGYDRHRNTALLDAFLMLLPAEMPQAHAALQTENHPAATALRARLREPTDAVTRRALTALLASPALGAAACDGLAFTARGGTLGDALTHGHLLDLPAARQTLQAMKDADALLLDEAERCRIATPARRWLPALWAALPLSPGRRIRQLAALHTDASPTVRIAALRHLLRPDLGELDATARQQFGDALVRYAHDPHESVALLATHALDRFSAAQRTTQPMARLADAPHATVRATAGRRIGPSAFARLWDRSDRLDPDQRAAALRALRKLDAGFDARLRKALAGTPEQQARALGWVHALDTPAAFDDDAARLTGSEEPRVAASAITALARSQATANLPLLESLTRHADGRVRANAVEALAARRAGEAFCTRLVEMIHDDTARPRANAIRALVEVDTRTCLQALRDMLRDTRPEHRRSALWLADASGLLDIARRTEAVRDEFTKQAATDQARAQDADPTTDAAPRVTAATVSELLTDLYAADPDNQGAAA